jgi:hypothetical protein
VFEWPLATGTLSAKLLLSKKQAHGASNTTGTPDKPVLLSGAASFFLVFFLYCLRVALGSWTADRMQSKGK